MGTLYRYYFFLQTIVRTYFWRCFFSSFGPRARVIGRIVVVKPENISFGKGSTLNEGVFLNAKVSLKIGDFVHISPGCMLNTGGLDYKKTGEKRNHIVGPIVIEDGVWLGTGVKVNPGVTIGKNSVIGAGAVVTKDIPANVVAVGVPAKIIKNIEE